MKKFQCTTCFEYYATPTTLKRHETTVHKAILPIACPQCEQRFRDHYCLKLHRKKHTHENGDRKRKDEASEEEDEYKDGEWTCDTPEEGNEMAFAAEVPSDPVCDSAAPLRVARAPRKRSDSSRRHWRPDRFECYVCESQFEAAEYRTHMRDHADDLRDVKDQLTDMLQRYSSTAEKINATISSFLAQDE